ncbi:TPR repeat-containing protein YfgC precursor [Falsiruegeria litorea R37]|uniref:TPR repeat-containing protein YfgC n=2 Tax=Falsiruegeria litorea TaxID=1280831 RepID=A0A1Y5SA93_9RHOB|nr:TPR repeat-containing protein YfgC precursor [Falsiruegeria litorea R37]
MAFERVSRLTSIPRIWRLQALSQLAAIALSLAVFLSTTAPAAAIGLLRDPDIENGLRELAFPILRAAGLSPNRVKILLVNDGGFNAFVVDHNTIFLNYGLILKVPRADVLQAVIAHEAAHIANGHIQRRIGNLEGARTASTLGLALALIAAAAGGGEAAAGIAAGTQSSAIRSFLAHTRAEESSADRSAANYLRLSGISLQGLIDLHRAFQGQDLLTPGNQDPYARSHPLTKDRIRAAQAYFEAHGDHSQPNANADYWFARIKGKISAFTRAPKWTLLRANEEAHADIRLMRQAIAHHRNRNLSKARAAIDAAIALRPDDPFYFELKGQILLESRRIDAAVSAYGKAVELAPRDPLILAGHGRALLAAGHPRDALATLEKARDREARDARMLRDLGVAYASTGQNGMASLVTAERYALQGRSEDAELHARRAVGQLPVGSTGWQRAQDVLLASERANKRKR